MTDIVLQKYISNSGHCSRRQAEELIRAGGVKVNGETAELGRKVSDIDTVEINGIKIINPKEKIFIVLNKPVGYTCTNRSFKGEKNVFELLPSEYRNLHVVGRLDKNSRGLVLLTNDGDYTLRATHPRYEHEKRYIVDFRFPILDFRFEDIIKKFKKGIDIGEGDGVVRVKDMKYLGDNRFEIVLTEGKKRQIRRMFKVVGTDVIDLKRIAIGDIELGDLEDGSWKKINPIP
ncbi:MAG: Pseudouridine synthase [Candidatus Falkowbacteria bacterium GW2011_GWC2_38_22]|uniref:Pseudouridine synthase n=1 Tax=Candidatus Falkowbacteria bacterium GW2011_GWE1_38_31 TaxID=1618638 RepID=A0A0G0MZD5_9BACT|nr:MAG: Pseudouridine synthase [Candidatus Falkowbacteria bacterium GW2011_GWF2_38_1205]KKQ61034.1 MAG: Pseudouridine synthase [Candidatus Falkowbacteria bacterium GW2011_GWC2_38_22]KKQ63437.1 MAG: Pseudouridine synthase [Candidatus Falkowbacteria bacterium GW2011_GWF1_38_22]KKQ65492.1 MAG: Pseudouridine synthase [Candidatus Falkowbacteria bacterium GW2011_GWE2_38_254]KKQ70201.1 MAG: Pseudouridine synthase [Candidatus Falkowbacteria bacterium GW2011_GWE1_38_31]KKQ72623.1 MAG: Pseudouridine syn